MNNPSSIREILTLLIEYKEHPEKFPRKLIYLAGGYPGDLPPPPLKETLIEVASDNEAFKESAKYGATKGLPEFHKALVKYEKEVFNRKIEEDEIIVGLGSTELTAAFMMACLDKNSEVILTKPSYLNYARQIKIEVGLNVKIKRWNLIHNGEYNPSLDEFNDLITNDTRLVIVTTPGNPDGKILSNDTLEGILDIAEEKDFWVMVDHTYRAFYFRKPPEYFFRRRREKEIVMCTLSKELRAPGWRSAYALADKTLLRAVECIQQARIVCPSTLVQMVLTRMFNDDEKLKKIKSYYEIGAEKYAKVAKETVKFLKTIPKMRMVEPDGGFFVFFDVSKYDNDSRRFCRMLLDEIQVALTPGIDFGAEGWVRLSYAPVVEEPQVIREAIERMKEILH